MDQITFSEAEYQTKKRKARREISLERMDKLISCSSTVLARRCFV